MNRHDLRIASHVARAWQREIGGALCLVLAVGACAPKPGVEVAASAPDVAWVASACAAASPDTAGWRRYRLGDLAILMPAEYRVSNADPYWLTFRGRSGSLSLYLHHNARYSFDALNSARRGQNWCSANLGGHQSEVLAWDDRFRGATYNFASRTEAAWGGQDAGEWLFARITASRLRDAYVLRDALHTIEVVRVPR